MELSNICEYSSKRIDSSLLNVENYVSTENMMQNKGGITLAAKVPVENSVEFLPGDILISNIRPYFRKIWLSDKKGGCSSDVLCIRALPGTDSTYLYYLLSQDSFFDYVMSGAKGCKMPRGDKSQIMQWDVDLPNFEDQHRIASILKSIDDKIQLNKQINHNLHNLAQELFNNNIAENACRSSGWRSASLLDIAEYLNGLAMQKYPAINGEFSLPVLKIKELGQQACDANSDRCTESIPEQFVVKDGDIIFSWSGTLLVDFWCGGKCGLNQHLFKVSSDMYPNWFVYFWTKHHLDRFIRIAKDKAVTMGHIKRGDLGKAVVVIPEDAIMNKLNGEIAPLISECIERRIENRKLQSIRNSLLPKLMSGELKINDLTC